MNDVLQVVLNCCLLGSVLFLGLFGYLVFE